MCKDFKNIILYTNNFSDSFKVKYETTTILKIVKYVDFRGSNKKKIMHSVLVVQILAHWPTFFLKKCWISIPSTVMNENRGLLESE